MYGYTHAHMRAHTLAYKNALLNVLYGFASIAGADGSEGSSVTAPPGFEVFF